MSNVVLKGEPSYFLRKGHLGVKNKNQSWQDVTWDWILKQKLFPRDDPRAGGISLQPVTVYVWDEHGKGQNPAASIFMDYGGKTFRVRNVRPPTSEELVQLGINPGAPHQFIAAIPPGQKYHHVYDRAYILKV